MPSSNGRKSGYSEMKLLMIIILVLGFLPLQPVSAAKESGSAKTLKKLQMMLQDATAERDRLSAENAKLLAELEQLKKQSEQEKKAATALADKHGKELATQKSIADEIHNRLDNTTARLHEVIDKYNALNQSKNELATEHSSLQNTQKFTASELKACEANNMKLYEASKEVIASYRSCRDKGIVDTLIDAEPVLQINSVEYETIAQDYEDKLNKQKFKANEMPTK
jgi:chromosome segregation ATPase